MDKLEFFSRRSNVRFFNVYEERDETSEDCVKKVVQLLASTRKRCAPGMTWKEHTAQAPRAVTSDRPTPQVE